MAVVRDVSSCLRLFGSAVANPIGAHQFRNVAVTRHALDESVTWEWSRQQCQGDEIACLVFVQGEARLVLQKGDVVSPGTVIFLHPHREHTLSITGTGIAYCLWVPWSALSEIENDLRTPELVVTMTPLIVGLRAFTASLFTQRAVPTAHTDYMLERILAEMAFGVLVEAVSHPSAKSGRREVAPIDRARTLMMVRRADADFGMTELATELHMSPRQMQRLFAAAKSTPTRELRQMRVALARELLSDETYAPLSIGEIAQHSGFKSAAALRRAFAEEGLPSPRRARNFNSIS